MSNPKPTLATPKRRRFLRRALWAGGGLAMLLVVAYFIVFSETFLRRMVLPKLSVALESNIQAEEISIRPWSRIHLKGVRFTSLGGEPLLSVEEAEASYRAFGWVNGGVIIDDVHLVRPTLHLVIETNGVSNLEPVLRAGRRKKKTESPSELAVEISRATLEDGFIHIIQHRMDNLRSVSTISNLNVAVAGLGNGRVGDVTLSALLKSARQKPSNPDGAEISSQTSQWNGNLQLGFDPEWKLSSIQGGLDAEVRDATGAWLKWVGSGLRATGDVAMKDKSLDLHDVQVTSWSTSDSPTNHVSLVGNADWSGRGGITGELNVRASPLDVTTLFDSSVSTDRPAVTDEPPRRQGKSKPLPPGTPRVEPEPRDLPYQQFKISVELPRLVFRDLDFTNFQAEVVLDRSRVWMETFQGFLNGRAFALTADLDMSAPGWKYDFGATLDHIDVEPVVQSVSPGLRGKLNGELVLSTSFHGAGITDSSLQKNLRGGLSVTLTNATLHLMGAKEKARTRTLSRVLTLEMAIEGAANLLRLPALMDAPIEWLATEIAVRNGEILVEGFALKSPAFAAGSSAEIPMMVPLTNSPLPSIPLHFALERSVASGANLVPMGAPTDTPYVALPDFMFLKGTLGEPELDWKKTAVAGLVLKSTAGLPGTVTSSTGQLLQSVGEILTGERLLDGGKKPTTNAPPSLRNGLNILKLPGTLLKKTGNLLQQGGDVLGGPDADEPGKPPDKK